MTLFKTELIVEWGDCDEAGIVFVGPDNVGIVEPFVPLHVPARRHHDDVAAIERGQVVLNPPAAQRVIDAILCDFGHYRSS